MVERVKKPKFVLKSAWKVQNRPEKVLGIVAKDKKRHFFRFSSFLLFALAFANIFLLSISLSHTFFDFPTSPRPPKKLKMR